MNMDIEQAFFLVINLPYFWNAMAGATMMAMFFGAIIYDGEVPHAKKGFFAVMSYIFMLALVMLSYILHRYTSLKTASPLVAYQLFIYPVQLLFLTIFWCMGFFGAIIYFRWQKGKHEKDLRHAGTY